jgi:hypothetical protein
MKRRDSFGILSGTDAFWTERAGVTRSIAIRPTVAVLLCPDTARSRKRRHARFAINWKCRGPSAFSGRHSVALAELAIKLTKWSEPASFHVVDAFLDGGDFTFAVAEGGERFANDVVGRGKNAGGDLALDLIPDFSG